MNPTSNAVEIGLGSFHHIVDLWRSGKSDSLIDYTRVTRVEPIALVDNDVLFSDMTPEIMQSLLATFAGYYLQAAALSLTVGKVEIMRHLDKLNPKRNPLDSAIDGPLGQRGFMMAMENYNFRLPRLKDAKKMTLQEHDKYDILPLCLPSPSQMAMESLALEAAPYENDPYSSNYDRDTLDNRRDNRDTDKLNLDRTKFGHQANQDDIKNAHQDAQFQLAQAAHRRQDNQYQHTLRKDANDNAHKKSQLEQSAHQHASTLAHQKDSLTAQQAHQAAQLQSQKDRDAQQQANQDRSHGLGERELALREEQLRDAQTSTEFGYSKDTITTLKELTNLSVGKMLSVEITDGNHKASVPVAVRLMAASLPSSTLAHMLSLGKKDTSVKARWHGWRSGRLQFWKDLVLCNDLIEEHRNALMSDKDGLYRQIVARKQKNRFAGILSGNPSVATASNMAVISKETADKIELETVGTLNNFNVRQKLFEPTSLMILVVVNKDLDRATFYYRGIAEKTELSRRDMVAANKGNGPDITDVLRAFTQGHAPSL